ncbi:PLP-dependent aminotransferase family protein [Epibacterium ulvae]|uniref:aminotransferase-like domain-containing protein n=1 Tax=Epibacterium ulvae TaxID=1156985 RepID=UPI00249218AD|nr:PLP-dependent aminotransferase family protein [Epibacterium ulvae]
MEFERLLASRHHFMKASEIRELLKLLDQPEVISFAGGIPDPEFFPREAFQRASAEVLTQAEPLQYSISEGDLGLRQQLKAHMADLGVPCGVENILITSGSQQALDYIGKLFLSPGDTALVESPTYLGALAAFNAYEPRYDRLQVQGNQSPEVSTAAAQAAGSCVKLAYVVPDFSNPTGETLGCGAREALLDRATTLDCAVIEDAAYQALRYEGEAIPSILSLELKRTGDINRCRTLYCGSFSKTLAPGLRVGWIVAAKPLIDQMVLIKQASDLHSPTLNQMLVSHVLSEGFPAHLEHLRKSYRERRDVMLNALTSYMPEGVHWSQPEGGMFVWLTLPPHIDGAALLKRALEQEKIAFVPGQAFHADGSGANTARLSFSCGKPDSIGEGVQRLARVLKAV